MKYRHVHVMLISTSLIWASLIGCTSNKEVNRDQTVLRLGLQQEYWSVFSPMTESFAQVKPDVAIEYVSTSSVFEDGVIQIDKYAQFIEEQRLDIVYMPNDTIYRELVGKNLLRSFDAKLSSGDNALADLYPPAIELLTQNKNREIYGVPLGFDQYGVYMNKEIFQRLHVPLPDSNWSWHDVFQSAQSIRNVQGENAANPIAGLSLRLNADPSAGKIIRLIGESTGNPIVPSNGEINIAKDLQVLLDTLQDGIQTGSVHIDETTNTAPFGHPFIQQTAAMAIEKAEFITVLKAIEHSQGRSVDWEVLSIPMQADAALAMDMLELNHVFGIALPSPHHDEAWEFIRYLVSEEASSSNPSLLNIRPNQTQAYDGRDLSPFYASSYTFHSSVFQGWSEHDIKNFDHRLFETIWTRSETDNLIMNNH
ncbi:extracellular solute-binding protein [Xylanibacillus composti]|uniref:Extracellular solute-binding protein n=1 Tax=Xylanibacillus composti TaxID=1572762 RepID=A0A8J4M2I9_9BACL|nr:extracellular solute-binding protein [Xylanibacillus composti]MDT9726512.1 extracellular solute-binding protein [Xylanibacillus composti]GIQ69915.1 hypothetical protein XYCOK13_27390 [Xylanibacillus composti]